MMNANHFPVMRTNKIVNTGIVVVVHLLLIVMILHSASAPVALPRAHDLVVTMQLPTSQPVPKSLRFPPPFTPALPDQLAIPTITPVNIAIATPMPAPVVEQAPAPADQTGQTSREEPEPRATTPADSAPRADASAAGNAAPAYPKISRKLGEQGEVLLDVFVQVDGTVGEIRVRKTSGFDRLDESALRTVRQWRFIPARQAGKTIAMWYVQPINFSLRNIQA